jgi:hypothetical protein
LRYARVNRDENHHAVIAELRARGFRVSDFAGMGRGCPDLYVSDGARGLWVEVKNPDARPGRKRGRIQAATDEREAAFRALHMNCVVVATCAEDVDRALQEA